MAGLEDLYREIILDHYRTPRNRGELDPPAVSAEGHNPLCGDEIRIYLEVRDGVVADVKFSGSGCSISQSSASMMTNAVKGKDVAHVRAVVRKFKSMMTVEEDGDGPVDESLSLGDLEALQGVVKFP
ncbi:MAG: Fe-S cluster assembly sulfur transfer protein SufU, partial [Actinomycetota bacterium]